ncbi:MAG: CDP-alcohol phosphatidyltransferase family protein [Burkholderiales bacterium]|nr:CDP-alcohol phosphatidyltransferase family protein [Phycisphaerae bacterium]
MEAAAPGDRRPIKTRESGWALRTALWLAARRISPNIISVFSVVCGLVAGAALVATRLTPQPIVIDLLLLLAIIGIQARLVCNLLDGMVAVEGKLSGGRLGEIFNDLPDRIADPIVLISAGICAGGQSGLIMGFCATIGALLTAYVRVLGKSIGAKAHFAGPMAKQHRMAVLTTACAISIVAVWGDARMLHWIMIIALAVICVGCVITVLNRLRLIRRDLYATVAEAT